MSRTDKDRPLWLIPYQEGYPINHDHRRGECVVQTLEYQREFAAGSLRPTWQHRKSKTHGEYEEYRCTKENAFVRNSWPYAWLRHDDINDTAAFNLRMEGTCWANWVDLDNESETYRKDRHTGCVAVHRRWVENENAECVVCDVTHPTCDPTWYGVDSGHKYSVLYHLKGKSVTRDVHLMHHNPERRSERDSAREWIKSYNAGDDLEDWDFNNRQTRHGVLWYLY